MQIGAFAVVGQMHGPPFRDVSSAVQQAQGGGKGHVAAGLVGGLAGSDPLDSPFRGWFPIDD